MWLKKISVYSAHRTDVRERMGEVVVKHASKWIYLGLVFRSFCVRVCVCTRFYHTVFVFFPFFSLSFVALQIHVPFNCLHKIRFKCLNHYSDWWICNVVQCSQEWIIKDSSVFRWRMTIIVHWALNRLFKSDSYWIFDLICMCRHISSIFCFCFCFFFHRILYCHLFFTIDYVLRAVDWCLS